MGRNTQGIEQNPNNGFKELTFHYFKNAGLRKNPDRVTEKKKCTKRATDLGHFFFRALCGNTYCNKAQWEINNM